MFARKNKAETPIALRKQGASALTQSLPKEQSQWLWYPSLIIKTTPGRSTQLFRGVRLGAKPLRLLHKKPVKLSQKPSMEELKKQSKLSSMMMWSYYQMIGRVLELCG
jgi:hypothetical protein